MALTKIFEPIRIRNLEIPNRIVRTAHGTHLSTDCFDDASIAYHAERAKGGCGLSIIEATGVHSSSENTLFNRDDRVIPGFKALMKAVRPHGMRMFQQLFHGGHNTFGEGGLPPWSPSTIPSPAINAVPIAMDEEKIALIIDAFARAAVRCREGGLDGVEIHAAHGYLIHQFLSPLVNRREDRWGGSLENRMRFLREILIAVRKAVGEDYVVGARFSASEVPGSLHVPEIKEVIAALTGEGLIDFVDASAGDYYRMDTMVSGMHSPTGYELPASGEIVRGVTLPRIVSGRFRTLEDAEQILRDGTADMVSLVRAQIADPYLVQKTRDGRADEVRPCIGCNQGCIGGLIRNHRLGCTVNPAVGYELELSETLIEPDIAPMKVVVVGGGPAGMETARVARTMGHEVILFEASSRLGGAVNAAARAPGLHGIGDITNWLEREIFRLGVDVRMSSLADVETIEAERPDAVVIATGSLPRMDGVQFGAPWAPARGVELPHVLSSHDLLLGPARDYGAHALILDDTGHFEAIAAAEFLIEKGVAVTLVTRHGSITPYVDTTLRTPPIIERLYRGDFTPLIRHHLVEIMPGRAIIRPSQSTREREVAADIVVLVTPNEPIRDLYEEIRRRHPRVSIVGDAHAPRDLLVAINEGHRAARGGLIPNEAI